MKQLQDLERHLLEALTKLRKDQTKQTRNELKKFEKDLLFFMQDKGMDEVAGGRIHFRCISCDQSAPSEWGHASSLFKQVSLSLFAPKNVLSFSRLWGRV